MFSQSKDDNTQNNSNHGVPTKGILKQSSSQITDPFSSFTIPSSQINFPSQIMSRTEILDKNNTTSRINTRDLQSKANRRVSFAPDVTLHSFDFVAGSTKAPPSGKTEEAGTINVSSADNFTTINTIENDEGSDMELTQPIPKDLLYTKEQRAEVDENSESKDRNGGTTRTVSSQNVGDQTMDFTMMNERLSPILPFNDPERSDTDKSSRGVHQQSEVTNQKAEDEEFEKKTYAVVIQEEPMEFTQLNIHESSVQDRLVSTLDQDSDLHNDEEAMELTQVQPNQQLKFSDEDGTGTQMELTTVFNNTKYVPTITQRAKNTGVLIASENKYSKINQKEATFIQALPEHNTTYVQSGSKKRRLNDDVTDSAIDFTLNIDEEMELTGMEKMSPVKLNKYNGTTTERLRTEESLSQESQPVETIITTEKYSLRQFIDEIGAEYNPDTNTSNALPSYIELSGLEPSETDFFHTGKLVLALYDEIPVLQMNSFISKELFRMNEQSKQYLEDFEKQLSSSNSQPFLLKKYFTSAGDDKKSLIQQLQVIMLFSKLKAKKLWFNWQLSQLSNLKNVLEENLTLLITDYKKVQDLCEVALKIRIRTENIRDLVQKEITLLKESPDSSNIQELSLENKIQLQRFKIELKKHQLTAANLPELLKQKSTLNNQIQQISKDIKKVLINQQLIKQEGNVSIAEGSKIGVLTSEMDLLQNLLGIETLKFEKSLMTVRFSHFRDVEIVINLEKSKETCFTVVGRMEEARFFDHIIKRLIAETDADFGIGYVFQILLNVRKLVPLVKQLKLVGRLYPVTMLTEGKHTIIEIEDYNFETNTIVLYRITFENFKKIVNSSDTKVDVLAKVIQGKETTVDELYSRMAVKNRNVLPWFNELRLTIRMI
ncbi:hypothetical protein KAFR_0C02080 [Kazachstania africana CBS 2517]|uniref:Spc7 kinetochore protein domain-containing protein n=1 Tax=Kazachstania africana (strain ATCC 22294 / BCRC 22015 / CBS 2517 / CECT 1963 / NBRC 1671 / NRRL Y-8276) TaxID=1071382 RepID=H2AS51_KAZAF|nr:hypothetical protein KAFR_0C02080 [Kazachstania africana CBS 2517]CCF57201.1 hypothetical protein KAFR_0C02080 [Kazachstania africana CBS 2517]